MPETIIRDMSKTPLLMVMRKTTVVISDMYKIVIINDSIFDLFKKNLAVKKRETILDFF